ncbi:hypothetical protein C2G38_2035084 [Gigaspora rosea]|uniref:DNA 3'-5' helicase n=1 Tax=Gigaspora rosea TaxID=44941 RepID=A0A397VFL5_9GLOM|nr:hypothetical protein C2G38_2035084 [Gigaspora rosea]
MNESFNRVKLNYADKKVDYSKSFLVRHAFAILHNNDGLLEMLITIRQAGNFIEFSEQNQINIGKIWKQRENKCKCNIAKINEKNTLRAKKIAEMRKQMEEFDFSKDLIPYGIVIKDSIINQEFRLSFANLIPDFDGYILCKGCSCFPKRSPKGGLCNLCYYYNEHGLSKYIINEKFYNNDDLEKKNPTELINSIINDFFKLNDYQELQRKSIESFLKGQNTLTILPSGARKTLIFLVSSILSRTLTVVFTPLKAIMENQLPLDIQEKIFSEVAAGITKDLWTTPEKFIKSSKFRQFLHNVSQTCGIQFVIDELHCILEFGHFRLVYPLVSSPFSLK